MELTDLKRKLRRLKRTEQHLRYGTNEVQETYLTWHRFFSLSGQENVRYPISYLLRLDEATFKRIADEYMAFVYSDYFSHDYYIPIKYFDSRLLAQLDLPSDADENSIKKRFRELAIQYHPDTGGDTEQFIQLMSLYRELLK